ncbi:MAG: ATP phosphoribosyltransferase regulatory subunit [Burkholderiaceae bacterium]|nr:ATP phosphoribosyltransferase regulatory subunit [Burkholderiaceae bacterium]
MPRWLLPENISDVLPREARRVEHLRRGLLDLYRSYGYELVIPPLIEHAESLLTGTGSDLDLRTFKLTDQSSGRLLALRADTTPQVARIDAHILNRQGVVRLCYAGSVLHARPVHPLATREPLQVGAELYGLGGVAADVEVLELAVASLHLAGLQSVRLDLGHTGVVRGILELAQPDAPFDELLAALSVKDLPSLRQQSMTLPDEVRRALLNLPRLNGGREVLTAARSGLPASRTITSALDELEAIVERCGADAISIDLSDLHGYRYHTGVTFAVHTAQSAHAVLQGGRYDGIGSAFGRARPAVGFSIYLRELAELSENDPPQAIRAPAGDDPRLRELVAKLRAAGETVVQRLAGESSQEHEGEFVFDRSIERTGNDWNVSMMPTDRRKH